MERRNLKVFRIKNGLTQAEMAERIGVSRSTYSDIESGRRKCAVDFLRKIQVEFNVPDSEIWSLSKTTDDDKEEG